MKPKTYNTPKRKCVVKTRLTEDERKTFEDKCAALSMSQSEYIRQAIFYSKITPVIRVTAHSEEMLTAVSSLVAQYGKIGSNLNQIARYLNEYGMTNIVTRRHEFATMQSIGMTNRQLRKMMISESFSYVLLAGIVGTLAAATLGMTLLRAFVENGPTSMMMTFQITLLPALIMLVLFLVLAFIVPVVALRLLNNRSVVERLRVNE